VKRARGCHVLNMPYRVRWSRLEVVKKFRRSKISEHPEGFEHTSEYFLYWTHKHCAISSQRKERHDSGIFVMSSLIGNSNWYHSLLHFRIGVFYVFRRCYNGTTGALLTVGCRRMWVGQSRWEGSTCSTSTWPSWQLQTGHVISIYRILFSC